MCAAAGADEGAFAWLTLNYLLGNLGKGEVDTMSANTVCAAAGADEGAFAWLTLNYLLGNLGKGEVDTMAAIDLGGGSVQQAYALTDFEAAAAPDGYVTQLSGGGRAYSVYVHRCAAGDRAAVCSTGPNASSAARLATQQESNLSFVMVHGCIA